MAKIADFMDVSGLQTFLRKEGIKWYFNVEAATLAQVHAELATISAVVVITDACEAEWPVVVIEFGFEPHEVAASIRGNHSACGRFHL